MTERQLLAKLRSAINSGDHKAVQRLVKGGVDVNARFWYDSTLLHEAVSMSSMELVEMLIRAGADVNSTNQDGRTALHLACRGGHANIVQVLIAAGTNLNKRTVDGKTCLHVAVWRAHEEVVEILLKAGADVNIPDVEGCTPLFWAARANYLSILKVLIRAGAKLNYRVKNSWTPMFSALFVGHMDVVRYLLLHGSETNVSVRNKTIVSLLVNNEHITQAVREHTLNMLIQAGYNLHKDTWIPCARTPLPSSSTSLSHTPRRQAQEKVTDSPAEAMAKWLDKKKKELPKLTCLCRTRVRKRLSYCNKGRSIADIIPQLPLPSLMVDFISFKHDPLFTQETKADGDN